MGLASEPLGQVGRGQFGKPVHRFDLAYVVVLKFDPTDEDLVELPAQVRRRLGIGPLEVGGEAERDGKRPLQIRGVPFRSLNLRFGRMYLGADAVLLAFEQVHRHRVRVVRVQQLLALASELGEPSFGPLQVGGGVLPAAPERPVYLSLKGVGCRRLDAEFGIAVHDSPLDGLGQDVALRTAASFLVAADAEEVEVFALGIGQAEPGAAALAVNGALQVVVMGPGLVTGDVVRSEHGLHLLE